MRQNAVYDCVQTAKFAKYCSNVWPQYLSNSAEMWAKSNFVFFCS